MCWHCRQAICPPVCPNYIAPPPSVVGICEYCSEPIYEGDDVIDYNGTMWHDDCFWEKHHRTAGA